MMQTYTGFQVSLCLAVVLTLVDIGFSELQCGVCVCRGDTMVDCTGKQLTEIPLTFGNETQVIMFTDNKLQILNTTLPYPELQVLYLGGNELNFISDDAFNNAEKLEKLFLNGNKLTSTSFTSDAFKRFARLTDLRLDHNKIDVLPKNWFPSIYFFNLTRLDLSRNEIATFADPAVFQNLKLTHLNLSHNALKTLEPGYFEGLKDLEHLDLSNNQLKNLPNHTFSALTNLKTLNLSYNSLSTIRRDVFQNLGQVTNVTLTHAGITSLERHSLAPFDKVEVIDLSYNNIEVIGTETFGNYLKAVYEIDITYNKLKSLEAQAFSKLPLLQIINISHNALEYIAGDAFDHIVDVHELDLSYNNLSEIPTAALTGFVHLHNFSFDGNPIKELKINDFPKELDKSFERFTMDYALELERVSFNAFINMKSLEYLSISHCPKLVNVTVDSFDAYNENSPGFSTVLLGNNSITKLDEFILNWEQSNKLLKRVDLDGNPWNCDCHIRWMKRYMEEGLFPHGTVVYCATPPEVAGEQPSELLDSQMLCHHEAKHYSKRQLTIGLVSGVVILVTIVGGVVMYKYKYKLPGIYKKPGIYNVLNRHGRTTSAADGDADYHFIERELEVRYTDDDETARIDLSEADRNDDDHS